MWGAIGITFKGDGRHRNGREFGKPFFRVVIFGVTSGESESPAIVMNHDCDMIRVVEGSSAAIERGIVEVTAKFAYFSEHSDFIHR